jgi:hypothetical protein
VQLSNTEPKNFQTYYSPMLKLSQIEAEHLFGVMTFSKDNFLKIQQAAIRINRFATVGQFG